MNAGMDVPQQSTLAVEVCSARLAYGRGSRAFYALKGVNLRVPEGVIYGLLGPSGCGKTTLLCAVVGRRRLKHGDVKVFGVEPGAKGSCVPGSWVGFMPQELSLYPEFTIEETLTFFGRLHGIDAQTLKLRTAFLLQFLDLPRKKRPVGALSGGQQRRVSFAAALIHNPPLLILDEPTVGVDPLLRQSIWNYLVRLTRIEGMTVLITTHYIEEARQANLVGLMREGRLLAESSPDDLMKRLQVPTLEECFLKLCLLDKDQTLCASCEDTAVNCITSQTQGRQIDGNGNSVSGSIEFYDVSSRWDNVPETDLNARSSSMFYSTPQRTSLPHSNGSLKSGLVKTYALTAKNMTRLWRNLAVVLFQFALPTIQVILLCLCVGRPPFDLPVAVVNHEGDRGIGSILVSKLDNYTIDKRNIANFDAAYRSVVDGSTWGVIEIGPNFTANFLDRFTSGLEADNATIVSSRVRVWLDMTNQQIGLTIQGSLLESFQEFAREVLVLFDASPELAELPVVFEKPVYGSSKPRFTEFVAPGVILSITYIMAVGLTALSFVEERKSGLFERSWVAGVTSTQILFSHMITQSVVLVFQVSGLLIFTFLVFDIPSRGPFVLVILITLLQGVTGMAYGLLISALVTQESTAIMIALGSFYPNLIMSGIVWPVQGMARTMRLLSYCLPQTMATEAMRAILSRGWDLSYELVWSGFLITVGWLILFLVAAGAIFKMRR